MLSVIIPTCNRNDLLGSCLDCLDPNVQTIDEADYEVVVTDDGEHYQAKRFVEENYSWAKWLAGPKKGPAANRNNGAKKAQGEWLIFIDDDCLPDEEILSVYQKSILNNEKILVFEGCIKADREQQSLAEESPVNETGGYLWSCNFMISKDLFLVGLNGFDEQFPYAAMEDVELDYRIKQMKISKVFVKKRNCDPSLATTKKNVCDHYEKV